MPRRRTAAVLAGTAVLATVLTPASAPAVAVPASARPWPAPMPMPMPEPVMPAARQDQLTITVSTSPEGVAAPHTAPRGVRGGGAPTRRTHTLDCHPAGGTHPDAPAACDAVDRASQGPRDPWQPVPADAMCAQIHGGPATARITGVWRGQRVDASFRRTDGCEIARWNALVPALPGPGELGE
ncbi:SSI family serine proteinase inhibitor [Streptomyces radiopugnans]|uniref:Subtilisin inhibitor-like n=1 Tax=Streptomyces radiopugnans TaxID=403935 RepID=A0A1H9CK11_9ACTN|nr:SSI family serine proteinase inhibitor [Streptomyces radiopugnans]SEQ01532.1 Subtilisin inhibitor-like [Streptomyces radiopugnans]